MDMKQYTKTEREDGSILFTPKEQQQDAPKPGEVWEDCLGGHWLVTDRGAFALMANTFSTSVNCAEFFNRPGEHKVADSLAEYYDSERPIFSI